MRFFVLAILVAAVAVRAEPGPDAKRQADRYAEILRGDPSHATALERLLGIHREAGDEASLLAGYRERAGESLTDALIHAHLLRVSGDRSGAAAAFAAAADVFADSPQPLLGLAEVSDDPTAALERALERTGGDPAMQREIFDRLARARLATGDPPGAIAAWESALALAPDDPALRRELAARLAASDQSAAARPHLEWLAENDAPARRVDALVQLSEVAETADDLPAALAAATQALDRLGPDHWLRRDLEQRLGDLHARAGSLESHLAELSAQAKANPRDGGTWRRIAALHAALAQPDEQIAALRQALATAPNDVPLARELAGAEADFGDPAQAAELLDALLARRPDDRELQFARAALDVRAGELEAARTRVDALVAAQPGDAPLLARAREFFQTNRLDSAIEQTWENAVARGDSGAALALARAAFAKDQPDRARTALRQIDQAALPDPDATAFLLDAAELLAANDQPDEAISFLGAARNRPLDSAESAQRLAAAFATQQRLEDTRAILEAAMEQFPASAVPLDRQLFDSLAAAENSAAAREFLAALIAASDDVPAPREAVRIARWQQWNQSRDDARRTLELALRRAPDSPDLVEALANLAIENDDVPAALEWLETLAELTPARAPEIARRIASLQLESGGAVEAAVDVFREAVIANPASVDALVDLAAARQRSDDWYGALETWNEAFARADAAERRTLLGPLIAVTDRLGLPDRGLEILITNATAQSTEDEAIAAWAETGDFALRKDRLDALAARLRQILAENPRDYPATVALADGRAARGAFGDALTLLERHARLASDAAAARERVLVAAERTGDAAAVVRAAAALIRADENLAAWTRAAETLERAGARDAASRQWRAVTRRFGRDPEALTAAAAYAERIGDSQARADAIYASAELAPNDADRVVEAARVAARRNDRERALGFYRRLLELTATATINPEAVPGFDEVPSGRRERAFSTAMRVLGGLSDPDSIAAMRSAAVDATVVSENSAALRLEAIRSAARMATGGTTREEWLAWCEAADSPMEAAWGFYEAGEYSAAQARLMIALAEAEEPARIEQALVWNALRGGATGAIREWIESEPMVRQRRVESLFLSLSRFLEMRAVNPATDTITALFPADAVPAVERWRAAWLLAAHSDIGNAVALGDGKLPQNLPPGYPRAELQLASWYLLLHQRERATELLAGIEPAPASGFDDPAWSALRLRWLLQTPGQRQAEWDAARAADPAENPLRLALLAALNGDDERATAAATRVVALWRETSGPRDVATPFDEVVRSSVVQLHEWRLPGLALAICAETGTPADDLLVNIQRGDLALWRGEHEVLAAASELQLAPTREVAFRVRDLPADGWGIQALSALVRRLEAAGFAEAGRIVRDRRREQFPGEPFALDDLRSSNSRTDAPSRRIALLESVLESAAVATNFTARLDHTEQLVTARIAQHEPETALPFVDRALAIAPADPRLARLKDRVLASAGRDAERRTFWQERQAIDALEGGIGLARLELDSGNAPAARELAQQLLNSHPSRAAELRRILFEADVMRGDLPAVNAELHRLAAAGQWETVIERIRDWQSATDVATVGASDAVVAVLESGLRSAPQPEVRFTCGRMLLMLAGPRLPLATVQGNLAQMRSAAEALPQLVPQLYEVAAKLAMTAPPFAEWFRGQMRTEWRDGTGATLAGEQLIQFAIRDGDRAALSELIDQFLDPTRFAEVSWTALADLLAREGHPALAARVYEGLAERLPDHPEFTFRAATQLWRSGAHSAAIERVEPWIAARAVEPGIHRLVADFFRDIDRPRRAAELYAELVADDVGVTRPDVWTELARLKWRAGDFVSAELLLRTAFQNPDNPDAVAVAEFLVARGNVGELDPDRNDLAIRSDVWLRARAGVARALVERGDYRRALAWLTPEQLPDPEVAKLLIQIAERGALAAEVTALWTVALAERPRSRALREQHAEFLASR